MSILQYGYGCLLYKIQMSILFGFMVVHLTVDDSCQLSNNSKYVEVGLFVAVIVLPILKFLSNFVSLFTLNYCWGVGQVTTTKAH